MYCTFVTSVSVQTPPVLPRWTQDKFFAGHPDEPERDCHGKKLEDNLAGGRGEGLMLRVKWSSCSSSSSFSGTTVASSCIYKMLRIHHVVLNHNITLNTVYLTEVKGGLHHPVIEWSEVFAGNIVDVAFLSSSSSSSSSTCICSTNFQKCVRAVVIWQHLKLVNRSSVIMTFHLKVLALHRYLLNLTPVMELLLPERKRSAGSRSSRVGIRGLHSWDKVLTSIGTQKVKWTYEWLSLRMGVCIHELKVLVSKPGGGKMVE